jgi:hypothetical protein
MKSIVSLQACVEDWGEYRQLSSNLQPALRSKLAKVEQAIAKALQENSPNLMHC